MSPCGCAEFDDSGSRAAVLGMATQDDIVRGIDAFMGASKRVVGSDRVTTSDWQRGIVEGELQLKLPIEVEGELLGGLIVIGSPRKKGLWFRLGILFPAMVCRIDHTEEIHTNSLGLGVNLPSRVYGPHYHPWSLNRSGFKGMHKAPRLLAAVPYDPGAKTFDANLRWFCAETQIESLPANHGIELPASGLLL